MKDENDKSTKEMLADIVSTITAPVWNGMTFEEMKHGKKIDNTNDILKGQTMPVIQFLDEVKDSPIDAADILTDEQLGRGGLVKIEAFVRTKTSAAASRQAKHREARKAEGIVPVTITIPAEVKKQVQAIAIELSSGKTLTEAIQSVTSTLLVTKPQEQITKTREQLIGERVLALTGWRLMIAKAIGIL